MSRHLLQDAVDQLADAYLDAVRLELLTATTLRTMVERRRATGQAGSGAPPAWNKALNRAVVVAAVGGWESYMESLAKAAANSVTFANKDWAIISGERGDIQTPSATKVRKLFWTLLGVDLIKHWDSVRVQVAGSELGGEGTGSWRSKWRTMSKEESATYLDRVVKVRHGFAHGDPAQARPEAGIAIQGAFNVNVQSHHAFNSVSALLQLSVLSTTGLAQVLKLPGKLHWPTRLNNVSESVGLQHWLAGSEAEKAVQALWRGSYPLSRTLPADESPIADLDSVPDTATILAPLTTTSDDKLIS